MLRPRSLSTDAFVAFLASPLNAAAAIAIVSMAESSFAPATLAVFFLVRRLAATISNGLGMGVSNVLQRYVPLHGDHPAANRALLSTGVMAVGLSGVALLLVTPIALDSSASALFGHLVDEQASRILGWTLALSVVLAFHFVAFGSLLGKRAVVRGQVLNTMVAAGIPIAVLIRLQPGSGIVEFLQWQTTITAGIVLLALMSIWRLETSRLSTSGGFQWVGPRPTRLVLTFGSSRASSAFLDALLATMPLLLARSSTSAMAAVAVAVILTRLAAVGVAPVGMILGVGLAGMLHAGDLVAVRRLANQLVGGVFLLGVIGTAALLPTIDSLLGAWLGSTLLSTPAVPITIIMGLAIPGAAAFHALKGPIDAYTPFPVNLVSLVIANCVMVVAFALVPGSVAERAAWSFVLAQYAALLGQGFLARGLWAEWKYFLPGRAALATMLAGTVSLIILNSLGAAPGLWPSIPAIILGTSIGVLAYRALAGQATEPNLAHDLTESLTGALRRRGG